MKKTTIAIIILGILGGIAAVITPHIVLEKKGPGFRIEIGDFDLPVTTKRLPEFSALDFRFGINDEGEELFRYVDTQARLVVEAVDSLTAPELVCTPDWEQYLEMKVDSAGVLTVTTNLTNIEMTGEKGPKIDVFSDLVLRVPAEQLKEIQSISPCFSTLVCRSFDSFEIGITSSMDLELDNSTIQKLNYVCTIEPYHSIKINLLDSHIKDLALATSHSKSTSIYIGGEDCSIWSISCCVYNEVSLNLHVPIDYFTWSKMTFDSDLTLCSYDTFKAIF